MLFVFVAYSGEGCDYSIECGTHVFNINANSKEEAYEKAKVHLYEDKGCTSEESQINMLKCYCVSEEIKIDMNEWNEEFEISRQKSEIEAELARAKEELEDCMARKAKLDNKIKKK